VTDEPDGALVVRQLDAVHIGRLASEAGAELHELTPRRASLEEAFMEMTKDSLEYAGTAVAR
jgi:ABC-2 type transport system ATP-binding protein